MITAKHEFMAPTDVLEHERELKAGALEAVISAPLIGTWLNCDKATRGLVKIVIAASGTAISIHAFGACTPTPCDWGIVPGSAYAASVSSSQAIAFAARYKFSFKESMVAGHLDSGSLVVETWDHFTDNSGRSDYYSRCYMGKQ